jgi:hypothetical protein
MIVAVGIYSPYLQILKAHQRPEYATAGCVLPKGKRMHAGTHGGLFLKNV